MSAGTVHSRHESDHVTLVLEGELDREVGVVLVDCVGRELDAAPRRIDIDLSVVTSFAAEGAAALARCRDLCGHVPDGLHYRTEGGPGQLALLAAFECEPVIDQLD